QLLDALRSEHRSGDEVIRERVADGSATHRLHVALDQKLQRIELTDAVLELEARPPLVAMIAVVERPVLRPSTGEEAVREDATRKHSASHDHDVAREAVQVDGVEQVVRELDDLRVLVDR